MDVGMNQEKIGDQLSNYKLQIYVFHNLACEKTGDQLSNYKLQIYAFLNLALKKKKLEIIIMLTYYQLAPLAEPIYMPLNVSMSLYD